MILFISINENFLNSSAKTKNKDLMIKGYNLNRSHHPSNTKRGGFNILQYVLYISHL